MRNKIGNLDYSERFELIEFQTILRYMFHFSIRNIFLLLRVFSNVCQPQKQNKSYSIKRQNDRKQILLFDHRFPNHRNLTQLSILELRFRSAIRQFFRESYLIGLQINRRAARRINFSPFERGFHVLFFARVYYPRADALRAGTKIGPSRYGAGNKPISL